MRSSSVASVDLGRQLVLRCRVAGHDAADARQGGREPRPERIGLHEVDDPDAASRDLVDVRRPDAARGRAELAGAALALLELVEQDVVRHHEVRPVADEQVLAVEAARRQAVELADERRRIDDHAVAEQVPGAGVEDARRDQVELEVPVRVDHRVAGIVPAAVADDEVRVVGQVVDHPALSLVTPLGADDGDDGHGVATTTSACGEGAILPSRRTSAWRVAGHTEAPPVGGARSVRGRAVRQARARTLSKQFEQ